MKNKITACVLSVLCAASLCGCSGKDLKGFDSYSYFGTRIRWVYLPKGEEESVWRGITDCADRVQKSVSLSEDGAVTVFNAAEAGAVVELDETAFRALRFAKEMYEFTEGAYNPATGGLIDLWGFSPRHNAADYSPIYPYDRADFRNELPKRKYIDAFLTLTDFSSVTLSESDGKYYALKPDVSAEVDGVVYTMRLNLGGIAKGLSADLAKDVVTSAGHRYGYLNFGASSMVVFENPKSDTGKWEISVVSPRAELGDELMTVYEKNSVLSSSGDSELFYEYGGKRYSHIIDPETGYPVGTAENEASHIVYAAVSGFSAAEGDALSTALVAMGRDRAIAFAEKYAEEFTVYLLYCEGGEYTLYTTASSDRYRLRANVKAVLL